MKPLQSFSAELQTYISYLQEKTDKPFVASNPKFSSYTLDVQTLNLHHRNKPLKRVRYTVEPGQAPFWDLSFQDGTKLITAFKILPGFEYAIMQTLMKFQKLCIYFGRLETNSAAHDNGLLPWEATNIDPFYKELDIADHYHRIYTVYALHILKKLKQDTSERPVLLLETGCGDGRCTAFITQQLKARTNRIIYAAGFDINHDNVMQARLRLQDTPHFVEQGNFSDIDGFLQRMEPFFNGIHNPIVIPIFSGVLCETVASGSRQALNMLQSIFKKYKPEFTIVGSLTRTLVNKHMFSRAGMQMDYCTAPTHEATLDNLKNVGHIYFLTPYDLTTYMTKQIKWSERRAPHHLDLTMSVHPSNDLKNLSQSHKRYLKTVHALDLSDAKIEHDDLHELATTIRRVLPKLQRIVCTETDNWCTQLMQLLHTDANHALKLMYRTDSPNAEYVPQFSSSRARRFQLFQTNEHEVHVNAMPVAPTNTMHVDLAHEVLLLSQSSRAL